MTDRRYSRNIGAITESEQALLADKHIFIAGCGGLGGYIFSNLLRMGIGFITVIDGDAFDISNLNRQLLSSGDTLGMPKTEAASEYAASVNPGVQVTARQVFLSEDNCAELISGHDLVIDALDNIESRRILAGHCDALGIPYVYGAIVGWNAQAGFFPAGTASSRIARLYPASNILKDKSSLSFTPSLCASIQCAEALKYLLGRGRLLSDSLLYIDLAENEFEEIPLT